MGFSQGYDRVMSRFDQILKEERNLARAQMAYDLKSALAGDRGILVLPITKLIHKYIDQVIDEDWREKR